MKLYHCPGTRSTRIVWLLEELRLPYELETFPLGDKAMREPDYLKVHPMGRVPALEDGDVTLFESGAIVEYLLIRHGTEANGGAAMRPGHNDPAFPDYLQWLHYAEGMLMPPVNTIVVETKFLPEEKRNPANVARARKLLGKMLGAVEHRLDGRDYLTGTFSGADIMTGHSVMAALRFGGEMPEYPRTLAYANRLQARPAFQKAASL